jgi:hypothetical protein
VLYLFKKQEKMADIFTKLAVQWADSVDVKASFAKVQRERMICLCANCQMN